MQENEEKETSKHPIEMTSDELLDFVVAPEIAERLRERVRDEPPKDGSTRLTPRQVDNHLCNVRGWGYLTGTGAMNLPEREAVAIMDANTRLIAAAPALYDALKGLAIDLRERDGSGLCWCPLNHLTELLTYEETGEHSDECKAARTAIAAAKGQS